MRLAVLWIDSCLIHRVQLRIGRDRLAYSKAGSVRDANAYHTRSSFMIQQSDSSCTHIEGQSADWDCNGVLRLKLVTVASSVLKSVQQRDTISATYFGGVPEGESAGYRLC